MAVIDELIREEGEAIGFGNYELGEKTKKDGFEYKGDVYKIKTFNEITKLEKNGMFVYESVPGTTVHSFKATESTVGFEVEGDRDAQVTLELEPETEYIVKIDDEKLGEMKTNLGGKLSISVELESNDQVKVFIQKK